MCNLINIHTYIQCEWHRMTRMTGPDCVVMCNLINTYIHTYIHTYIRTYTGGVTGSEGQEGANGVGERDWSRGWERRR